MNLQALLVENVPIPNKLEVKSKRVKKPKVMNDDFVEDVVFEEYIKEEENSFEDDEAFVDVPTVVCVI